MKWVVISTYSPKIGDLYEITCPNKEAYCERHGYKFEVIHFSDDVRDRKIEVGYGLGFLALLKRVRHLLNEGFGVMQIDADAMITNPEIRIEDRIVYPDAVVVAREPIPYCAMNGGVVLMNPCALAIDYVSLLISKWDEWKENPLAPQGWVCDHLDHPTIQAALRIVDPADMNAIPEERDGFPHMVAGELWKPGDWIAHCYGMSLEKKIEWAKKLCTT